MSSDLSRLTLLLFRILGENAKLIKVLCIDSLK
jgi:hypothetical protein